MLHSLDTQRRQKGIASPPLPIQQATENPVYRRPLIAQRHILPAAATGIPALPALSALLVFLKTKRAARIPPSATRTRRRYPIVILSAVLAIFTARHTRTSVATVCHVGRASATSRRTQGREVLATPPPTPVRQRQTPRRPLNIAAEPLAAPQNP